jgi:hypothetical protein
MKIAASNGPTFSHCPPILSTVVGDAFILAQILAQGSLGGARVLYKYRGSSQPSVDNDGGQKFSVSTFLRGGDELERLLRYERLAKCAVFTNRCLPFSVSELFRKAFAIVSAIPTRRVFGNADGCGADRTWDRAGAAQERAAEVVRKVSVYCFGANDATIFSKRGSPRSGSQS